MVTVDDVAGALKTRLAATSGYTAAIPGGTWLDRGPDAPAGYPYLVLKIEPGEAELFSGSASLQPFTVTLAAYCPVGASGVNVATVEQVLNTAMASQAGNAALQAANLRNAGDKILHCLPVRPGGKYDLTMREGRDVFAVGLTVSVLCESDRSAS